jgi:Fur family peroxide stress response transcriptional regulator
MTVSQEEIERRLEHFQQSVRAAGVKLTHQRLEVFRAVAASLDHPDAETVFRAVRSRLPTVSLDTVYRTLWTLNDLGLIAALGPRRESVRFDANLEPHHHFVCLRCGMTRDFRSPALETIPIPEEVRGMGTVVRTQVEVRGVCSACAGSTGQGPACKPTQQPQERTKT